MADEKKIVIELKSTGDSANVNIKTNEAVAEGSNEISKVFKTLFQPITTLEKATVGRNIIVNQAYQQAKQALGNVANYQVEKYFALQENYLGETDYSNMMTAINKVASFGGAVLAGAAMGGPAAPVTAAIAAVSWGVNEVVQARRTVFREQLQIATTNYQTQFQQTRMGLIDGRGGTNQ